MTIFAVSAAIAALVALIGVAGVGVGSALIVFVGNPFSVASSAPELLPEPINHIGQWLPPGAASSLLRDTTYFDGNGAGSHLGVLIAWAVAGAVLIVLGHHTSLGFGVRSEGDWVPAEVPAETLPLARHRVG
jgi:hypothetical protein